MEGWIKLHRKFLEWEWFNTSEMVHLFIHLLLNANNKDGHWRGNAINRGQIIIGLRSLSKSTNISVQTLRTCLKRLEKTQEINIKVTHQFSIITICKYDDYQGEKIDTNTQINTQSTHDQHTINNKQEYKKEKKERINGNGILKTPSDRQKDFYNSLIPFLSEHPKERLKAFYDFWSELTQDQKKMKCELEKTWETKKRLDTWKRRDKENTKTNGYKLELKIDKNDPTAKPLN